MQITLPSLEKLQPEFQGKLVDPKSADYDQLRVVFYGGIDSKPALIVLAENVSDVQRAVTLAVETGMELAVRSGGHSFAGFCTTEGGIVLDLRKMKAYTIDADKAEAWVEPGMTAGEFTKAADAHDMVLGFGDTGSVGVGGITVGGGVGFLARKYGLTIDNLLAAEVVTADGALLEVSPEQHPELFWAIRGGGGNFGVVTRFKFKLHKLPQVVGGILFLPAEAKVLAALIAEADKAPVELSGIINVMPAPPMPMIPAEHHGKLVIMAMMVYAGDADSGNKVLAPFRALATPIADTIKPIRYHEMFFPDDGSYHPTAAAQTFFMGHVDLKTAELIMQGLQKSDAKMRAVQLRVLGGAVKEVAASATAYAHRQQNIMGNVAAFYDGVADQSVKQAWVDQLVKQLNQGYAGAYVNFLGMNELNRAKDAYPGETWSRLVAVKKQYDPTNLFKLNINIA